MTDRHTDASDLIICLMTCYRNGTDNKYIHDRNKRQNQILMTITYLFMTIIHKQIVQLW